jgi:hypothetical protein
MPLLFPLTLTQCLVQVASAQTGRGKITGEARGQAGAIIPSVKGTVTEVQAKQAYASTSGELQ